MSTERHDHPSDGPAHGPAHERGPEHGTDDDADLAAEHPGEGLAHRSRLTVAVVAAAVLLAGGGGAYWAAASGDGGHDAAAQPLRFDGPVIPSAASGGGNVPVSGGGDTYRLAVTLPRGPSSAPVYRTAGGVDRTAVQRLAGLLGLHGQVRSLQGSWQVSDTAAGGGPALLVGKDAPGTWSYTRSGPPPMTVRPYGSASSGTASSGTASSGPASRRSSAPASPPAGADPGMAIDRVAGPTGTGGAPVPEQKAMAVTSPVLAGLGLSGARIDAAQTMGALRMVTADPVVGGLPTHGWATTFQIGADGALDQGYGRLSALDKGDTYPVVDAGKALRELNAIPVAYPAICRVPMPDSTARPGGLAAPAGPANPADPTSTAAPAPSATPSGNGSHLRDVHPCLRMSRVPVEVRGARFGLAAQFVSGTQELVPAWLFDAAQPGVKRTSVVAQTAVDPAYVTTGGRPGGPGANAPGGPSSAGPATPVDPGGPVRIDPVQPVDPQAPRPVPLTSYHASGSTLTLAFWGGVCSTYQAVAVENGAQVLVRVTQTPAKAGQMCPMIAKSLSKTVTLKQPLGSRTVVDTSNGQPVRGQ